MRQGGQALVEFALVSIGTLLFLFVIIDGCRAVYSLQTVGEAAREGAHVAELEKSTDAQIRSAVNAHSGMLGDLGSGATITPVGSRTPGQTVTVKVTYQYRPVTPLLAAVGAVNMSSATSVVVE